MSLKASSGPDDHPLRIHRRNRHPEVATHHWVVDAHGQMVLEQRLRDALSWLNPSLPASALDDALRRLTHHEGATLDVRNRAFHRMLVAGVTVEYRTPDGTIRGEQTRAIDFDDWAATASSG